jgi:hypothetical protein
VHRIFRKQNSAKSPAQLSWNCQNSSVRRLLGRLVTDQQDAVVGPSKLFKRIILALQVKEANVAAALFKEKLKLFFPFVMTYITGAHRLFLPVEAVTVLIIAPCGEYGIFERRVSRTARTSYPFCQSASLL